jgi:hypothetical protein
MVQFTPLCNLGDTVQIVISRGFSFLLLKPFRSIQFVVQKLAELMVVTF